MATLGLWYWSLGSIAIDHVVSPNAEIFYWATIMFSQTLGTALGDFVADTTGLGYEGGALVFGAALALVAALYFCTRISRTVLFWAAFILTRPLGATIGDFLEKPVNHGGLALALQLRWLLNSELMRNHDSFGDRGVGSIDRDDAGALGRVAA